MKQAKLAEKQPKYSAGNFSKSFGDDFGLRLPGRRAAQLEV